MELLGLTEQAAVCAVLNELAISPAVEHIDSVEAL